MLSKTAIHFVGTNPVPGEAGMLPLLHAKISGSVCSLME